jgi:hypothetical protein
MAYFRNLERSEKRKLEEARKPRIAICIPTRGMIHLNFLKEVYMPLAVVPLPRCHKITTLSEGHYSVVQPRNSLVEFALKSGADYIWFLDDDTLFPNKNPNEVLKMLYDTNQPIVSGLSGPRKSTMNMRLGLALKLKIC